MSRIPLTQLGLAAVVIVTMLCAPISSSRAEANSPVQTTLEDMQLYFTAPLHWQTEDWLYFGNTVSMIAVAHEFDGHTRHHFATGSRAALDGQDRHSTRDAIPTLAIVAGTWAYAALTQDRIGQEEGWSMIEAAGLSGVMALALKAATGRLRPNETTRVDSWREGGSSFPSMHTTVAFAVGTVLAESGGDHYRWLRRGLGYGIAAGTAYFRLQGNAHWVSDTVAGAALGLSTAHFVLERRSYRTYQSIELLPIDGGLALAYSVPLH